MTDYRGSTTIQMNKIWRPVFDRYDRNGSGRICLEDFKRILQESNRQLSEDISPEILESLISQGNHSETIDYQQFLQMINSSKIGTNELPRLHRLVRYAAMAVVPKSKRQSVILKYLDEYNCMPPPIFIILISLLEIGIFVYYCVILQDVSTSGPVPWKSVLIYNPCRRHEVWRFFTYMFIHAGVYHIFSNLLIQLFLGIPLEMVHKWWRVGIVYLTGVIAGSLASSLSDPHTFLAGASGGVYALLAAHLANVIINWNEMEFNWARLLALLIFITTDFGMALYGRYKSNETRRVSYSAHLAGALVGLFVGFNVLRNLKAKRWEIILAWFSMLIYVIFMSGAILFNLFNTDYFYNPNDPLVCKEASGL